VTLPAIFSKVMDRLNHTNIEATLNIKADQQKIDDWVNFYLRNWRII
jgi:hypothetical protein